MTSTPSAVVQAAFNAEDTGDWTRFVALVHRDALEEFRQAQLAACDPDGLRNRLLRKVFGVPDRAGLEQLPVREALRRWGIAAHLPGDPTFKEFREQRRHRRILGELQEGDDLAHVLFRVWYDPGILDGTLLLRPDRVRLITTKREAAEWRIMLNGGLFFDENGGWGLGLSGSDDVRGDHVAPA